MSTTNPVIAQLLLTAASKLATSSDTARLDADVLLAHTLDCDRAWLYAHANDTLSVEQTRIFNQIIDQRSQGQPVAYLTGEQEFWSLTLHVDANTLIPRPDTELLVERGQAHIETGRETILELGTGTGAVAIALATIAPDCDITATDVSAQALAVAQRNIERHACLSIRVKKSHWFDDLDSRQYDMIVSNPPYLRDNDHHLTQGDVRAEPRLALTSGADGLDAIRHIANSASAFMRPGAWLALEHGHDQAELVRELLHQHSYSNISSHRDLGNHERVTEAQFWPVQQRGPHDNA